MSHLFIEPIPPRTGKSEIVAFLATVGRIEPRRIGRIELGGKRATVEVPEGAVGRLLKALDGQLFGNARVRVWTQAATAAGRDEDHFQRLARLLELEGRAEARAAMERARRLKRDEAEQEGESLLDLAVADEESGLGGRYLLTLVKRRRGPLPWTRLSPGSPVVLSPDKPKAEFSCHGVVCERSEAAIRVALDRVPEELGDHEAFRLDASFDEAALNRQKAAMEQARLARGDRFALLRDVLLGLREPEFGVDPQPGPLDRSLNAVQMDAVRHALSARDVALIHGPPGTGKTTAVVELIRQSIRRGKRVLACAPSNLAVDNIFERLLASGERAVRLGHPARVLPGLREHTLDLLVEKHRDVQLAKRLVKQAMSLFREAERFTRAAPKPGHRKQLRDDARSLLADARRMEQQAVESVLDSAAVLCATTTGIDSQLLGQRRFDVAVIDEACQSVEPGCWIPLLRCDRAVFAGDHCQLPPTIVSREAADEGFGVSIFERLMEMHGQKIARRLTVQYRMHASIMEFSSREFYDGQLEADATVAAHTLVELEGVADLAALRQPIDFVDTAGAGYDEQLEPDGESRLNPAEAELVARKVRMLLDAGVPPSGIAVIAPYAAQVRLLRQKVEQPGLEIDTVDGFQGREKEAVLISLVRSNPAGEIGFLGDVRRMNVALTRARRKLIVVGDSATLGGHPFYERLLEFFEQSGAYRSVWQEDER